MVDINWAGALVAGIGVVSAWLSGRSARKASEYSSDASVLNARTAAETDAYNRARAMDTETIRRQDEEINELRAENVELRKEIREVRKNNERLNEDNDSLRRRMSRLEQQVTGETNE